MYRIVKPLALPLAVLLTAQIIVPTILLALTSGPVQPEYGTFTKIGTTEMVDPFTGDLTYNIPLMDVDGYPINIAYHSGATMEEEASWVGLGWSLNMGAINRTLRGLPDDFDGDRIVKESHIKENKSWGVKAGYGVEVFGLEKKKGLKKLDRSISANFGIFRNSYTGYGFEFGASPAISATYKGALKGGLGLGLGYNSHDGFSQSINASLSAELEKKDDNGKGLAYSAGVSVAPTYNSRGGMKELAFGASAGMSALFNSPNTDYTEKNGQAKTNSQDLALFSLNGDASIPTGTKSYTPHVQMPLKSSSGTMRITVGTAKKVGRNKHGSIEGYFSNQKLATELQSNPAYGYCYSQDAATDDALYDFNLEKDGVFTEKTPNLPVSNFTYDLFTASGHGVSGMFRPFRGDIGVLSDAYQKSDGTGNAGGIEVGIGDLVHVGVNYSLNYSLSESGKWSQDNAAAPFYKFAARNDISDPNYRPLHEVFYFKEAGEKTIGDPLFDAGVGGRSAVRMQLDGQQAKPTLEYDDNNIVTTTYNSRHQREKRQQVMSVLSAAEASTAGLRTTIDEYPLNDFDMSTGDYRIYASTPRVNPNAKAHHLSELSVLKPDGTRYIYGIPAYNVEQRDVTFAVATGDCSTGLATYDTGDNSIINAKGTDNYFERTITPAYAHSFLLTAVLSPDYADQTGDGVSDDDPGTSVKLNYTRVHSEFRWRVPLGLHTASYNEGLKSDSDDDKGSYIYGKKEIWYVHSVETKTHVAEFYISPRHDGFGVKNEDGELDFHQALWKLDSIRLFSKEDRILNGANATPIKSVHFGYEYSLCPGVPNNDISGGGKLTLDSLYFTYGNLPKGAVNAYKFKYSSNNPAYQFKGYDRWGNYKANVTKAVCDNNFSTVAANPDDPYVEQDKISADNNASAWQLTQVTLPSKGNITITYESDDYAYTQDKKAMRMVPIRGASVDPSQPPSNNLFEDNGNVFDQYRENTWLCFDLPPYITTKEQLDERYIAGQADPLHFRFFVDITGTGKYEYVTGYAHILETKVTGLAGAMKGWVLLERTTLRDKQPSDFANPISKAAWQLARLEMTADIFPGSDPQGSGESAIKGLFGFVADMRIMFTGYNRTLRGRGFGKSFIAGKSTIRLVEPTRRRLGGGIRVRRIESSDEWSAMAGGTAKNATYGQEFTYTMSGNESADEISSGVASYEPMIGANENPLHLPVEFTTKHFLAPDDYSYEERPFGEAHFPDPSVGYRRVTIRDIYHDVNGITQHTATGKVVHEFYTALDFPVRATQTEMVIHRKKPKFLDKLFRARSMDYVAASQGYAIEKNDMHGKPKAQWTYAEGGVSPISGVEYFYRTEAGDASRLNSSVAVIDSAGRVSQGTVGRDIDVAINMRETNSGCQSTDIASNVDVWSMPATPPIMVIPTLWGKTTEENTRFRSAVVTKAIYVYGILDSIVAHEDGARVSTENIARDAETGEVLLTRTANTFHDPVYNFTYPAHWAFDGMGSAYRNIGVRLENVSVDATGKLTIANAASFLLRGDEVLLTGNLKAVAWVIGTSANKAMLVDRTGHRIPAGTYNLLVTRSGRRNLAALPVSTVSSLDDPIATGRILGFAKVLNADAIEYSDIWRTSCGLAKMQTEATMYCDSLTAAAVLLGAVLKDVAEQGRLLTNFKFDATIPSYRPDLLGFMQPHFWVPNISNSSPPSTTFAPSIGGATRCQITLTAPTPIVWGNVISFGPISLDPTVHVSGATHTFQIEAILADGSHVILHGEIPCIVVATCHATPSAISKCGVEPGELVNPFVWGLWGNWRHSKSYSYLVDRTPISASTGVTTRYDGQYESFNPFWSPPFGGYALWSPNTANWTWTSKVTRIDGGGFELENQDALNRYSGALYGYRNTLPTAVVSNARYRSIAFDGFEEFSSAVIGRYCGVPGHWDFFNVTGTFTIDDQVSHTGNHSLRVDRGNSASVSRTIEAECIPNGYLLPVNTLPDAVNFKERPRNSSQTFRLSRRLPEPVGSVHVPSGTYTGPSTIPLAEYGLQPCDCNGLFSPEPNDTYIFGGWVRESLLSPLFNNGAAEVTIDIGGSAPASFTFVSSGLIVEGWRRIEGSFPIAAGATSITVTLKNGASAPGPAYFDDLRIHPNGATLKTYVFDNVTRRLMAILDERNYAAIYEYDYEGQWTRLKKETERGVATVQESRSDLRKH